MSSETSTAGILAAVKGFIATEVLSGDEVTFDASTDLIEEGILDSMSLVRLIAFLEERFGIDLLDEDVVPQNFQTLRALESLVTRYRRP